ncbi:hypothetical protein [Candidatus Pelagibacter ubique]|uniref:hypothetical protein n=1 Tax=Pelagibacter ubique TaxID=198252 RepID=UPI0003C7E9F5
MKNLRYIFLVIVFLFFKTSFAFSDLTASAPTNIIQSIASATSFSSINENTADSADQVQNATSEAINTDEVLETVQQDAETFGQQNDGEALAVFSGGETQLVVIGGEENELLGKKDLEPNLDTVVYDTGMMTLTKEGGNYNNDNTNTIFDATPGAQQARIKVYVDFKRNVFFGEIESTVTLHNGSGMTTLAKGGAANLGDTEFPIDKELTKTLVTSTGQIGVGANDPFPWFDESGSGTNGKHSITSFIREDGQPAEFWDNSERLAMQKNVSHGTGGSENVLIEARFTTPGEGTLGTSTASFEASHAAHNASAADFIDGVVRYSATANTVATNFTGD